VILNTGDSMSMINRAIQAGGQVFGCGPGKSVIGRVAHPLLTAPHGDFYSGLVRCGPTKRFSEGIITFDVGEKIENSVKRDAEKVLFLLRKKAKAYPRLAD
jgi:hypothetical protein